MNYVHINERKVGTNIGNIIRTSKLASALLALPMVAGLATESFAQAKQSGNGIAVVQAALRNENPARKAVETAMAKAGLDCNSQSDTVEMLEAVITGKEVVVKRSTKYGLKVEIDLDTGLPLTKQVTSYSLEFGSAGQAKSFASELKAGLNGAGKDVAIQRDGCTVTVEKTVQEKRLEFSQAEAQ